MAHIVKIGFFAALFAVVAFLSAPNFAQKTSFFPEPPKDAKRLSAEGILNDYGIGNSSGTLYLQDSKSGTEETFYISSSIQIDGKPVTCIAPPKGDFSPSADLCSDWPKSLVLGKTKVRVSYWFHEPETFQETYRVTDSLNIIP